MPEAKQSYHKRKSRRSTKPVLTKSQYAAISKIAQTTIRKNAESKYFDYSFNNNVDFSGTIESLTEIVKGNDASDRDGDQVRLQSLSIRGSVLALDTDNTMRVMIIQWFPENTPTIGDVLQNHPGTILAPFSQLEIINRDDFRVP